jgi:hypothetical protein
MQKFNPQGLKKQAAKGALNNEIRKTRTGESRQPDFGRPESHPEAAQQFG